jgi:hypothetical protein
MRAREDPYSQANADKVSRKHAGDKRGSTACPSQRPREVNTNQSFVDADLPRCLSLANMMSSVMLYV